MDRGFSLFSVWTTATCLIAGEFSVTHAQTPPPCPESTRIFGDSTVMENESLLFYKDKDNGSPTSHLLFPATHIRRMTNTAGDIVYEEGKDFTLSDDKLTVVLPPTSNIPFFTHGDMYLKAHDPNGISHLRGDPNTWLLWGPKTDLFLHTQCLITYEHAPSLWRAYLPKFAGALLPKTLAKLKNKEPLTIGVSGDSIGFGYQSTSSRKLPPNRPSFFPQVVEGLKAYYGGEVTLKNRAIPG
jgi:acyl-CoA thioesterase I